MKRLIKILGLILLVATVVTSTIWYSNPRSKDPITSAIEQQIAAGKKQIVLAEITGFEWDTVVILGPYSSAEVANKALGFTWDEYKRFEDVLISEVSDVIIFVKAGKVIKSFEHSRGAGDFTEDALDIALTPEQAVFEVITDSKNHDWTQLKLSKQVIN